MKEFKNFSKALNDEILAITPEKVETIETEISFPDNLAYRRTYVINGIQIVICKRITVTKIPSGKWYIPNESKYEITYSIECANVNGWFRENDVKLVVEHLEYLFHNKNRNIFMNEIAKITDQNYRTVKSTKDFFEG